MRIQHDRFGTDLPPFKKGDQVWLDGKNIHTDHPSEKLRPKRFGPFEIIDTIGTVNFKLKLPKSWQRIHDIFHASQLTPYKENEVYGPNYPKPAPDLIEGQEEFEVEAVIGARRFRRWKTLQYLIKWKGYPESDNSWEAASNVTNAKDTISDFYRRHPRAVKEMEASILTLVIELEHNRAVKEDQIKKKLTKHHLGKKLLATGLVIPQIMEEINKRMTQLKKQPQVP